MDEVDPSIIVRSWKAIDPLGEESEACIQLIFTEPAHTPADFAAWATENIADENTRGVMDNPSGDGIANLLKYALGLDPAVVSTQHLPFGIIEADGNEYYLTLAVSKNSDATKVELEIEVSGDLVDWHSGSGHTTVLLSDKISLKVRDATPIPGAGRRFIRLKVSAVE